MKRRNKKNIINGYTKDNRYIYLMGLVGIPPEYAKKDIVGTKINTDHCNWKGYCKKCGMVHIE